MFEEKLAEGYAAFKIFSSEYTTDLGGKSGTLLVQNQRQKLMGEQLQEFDSKAETIQMTPPMVGG
jgi:hypothetical protein